MFIYSFIKHLSIHPIYVSVHLSIVYLSNIYLVFSFSILLEIHTTEKFFWRLFVYHAPNSCVYRWCPLGHTLVFVRRKSDLWWERQTGEPQGGTEEEEQLGREPEQSLLSLLPLDAWWVFEEKKVGWGIREGSCSDAEGIEVASLSPLSDCPPSPSLSCSSL